MLRSLSVIDGIFGEGLKLIKLIEANYSCIPACILKYGFNRMPFISAVVLVCD